MKDMVGLAAAVQPVAVAPEARPLLARCQAGDRVAFEQLFSQNAARVFRWAVLLGLSAHDAEDAAQEVLATAARRIGACAAEAALTSWLFQITRRVVANARRSAWVKRIFRPDDEADLEAAFERGEQGPIDEELTVRKCFARLSRAHAEVLLLAEVEGYTKPEIAALLGLPEGTVASRLRLAKEAFRKTWDEAVAAADEGGGR